MTRKELARQRKESAKKRQLERAGNRKGKIRTTQFFGEEWYE